jgi:hypothetical protein
MWMSTLIGREKRWSPLKSMEQHLLGELQQLRKPRTTMSENMQRRVFHLTGENSSDIDPLESACIAITVIYPSAYVLTALYRILYVEDEESYVPVAIEELKSWKNANEVEVTVIEPCSFHV